MTTGPSHLRDCLQALALEGADPRFVPTLVGGSQELVAAVQRGAAPYVALLSSAALLTPTTLGRLVASLETTPDAGMVCGIDNRPVPQALPLPPGVNPFALDVRLAGQELAPVARTDLAGRPPHCAVFRRQALEQAMAGVGAVDEHTLGRLLAVLNALIIKSGWRSLLARNAYIWGQGEPMPVSANDTSRWGSQLPELRAVLRTPRRWDPLPAMHQSYRQCRDLIKDGRLGSAPRAAARGARAAFVSTRDVVTTDHLSPYEEPGRLRVTYLMRRLGFGGGDLSVFQLVSELVLLGVDARIATLRIYPEVLQWRLLSCPLLFGSWRELVRSLPQTDVVVATHWSTAEHAARLVASGRAKVAAHFLQDYESWFYPESDTANRARVRASYALIPNRIVKSDWLARLLEADGFPSTKIPLGMDLDTFTITDAVRRTGGTVLAIARPRSPRRGYTHTIDALRLVQEARPGTRIILCGRGLPRPEELKLNCEMPGFVPGRYDMARLYAQADVFLDGSIYQAFGRPGLEAMACGAACVLTNVGGVGEYARDGVNSILVPPELPEAMAQAVLNLLGDPALRARLAAAGQETARGFCHKREARETLEYFTALAGAWRESSHE